MRHAENVVRLRDQLGRELAAALPRDVNAQFLHRLHRKRARRLALARPDARGHDLDVPPPLGDMAENAFRHGAAANISGADKQDGFHGIFIHSLKLRRVAQTRQPRNQGVRDGRSAAMPGDQIQRAPQDRVADHRFIRVGVLAASLETAGIPSPCRAVPCVHGLNPPRWSWCEPCRAHWCRAACLPGWRRGRPASAVP